MDVNEIKVLALMLGRIKLQELALDPAIEPEIKRDLELSAGSLDLLIENSKKEMSK